MDTATVLLTYGKNLSLLCIFQLCLYFIFNRWFELFFQKYNEFPSHRKLYVLKNITKSFVLAFISIYYAKIILNTIYYNEWPDNEALHFIGTLYVSTDVTGLFLVRLPLSSRLHHTCVLILGGMNMFSDYKIAGIHRSLVYLTYFSTTSYLVNTFLSVRDLTQQNFKRWFSFLCTIVYVASIGVNVYVQHAYFYNFMSSRSFAYIIVYWMILMDDIILLKYLVNNWFFFKSDNIDGVCKKHIV